MFLTLTSLATLLTDTHFDMTVTLGNLLTIAAFAIAAIAFGIRIETKVAFHEIWIKGHAECSRQQSEVLNELREAISYMRGRNGFHEHRREGDNWSADD